MLQAAANSLEDAERFDAVFLNCAGRETERGRKREREGDACKLGRLIEAATTARATAAAAAAAVTPISSVRTLAATAVVLPACPPGRADLRPALRCNLLLCSAFFSQAISVRFGFGCRLFVSVQILFSTLKIARSASSEFAAGLRPSFMARAQKSSTKPNVWPIKR